MADRPEGAQSRPSPSEFGKLLRIHREAKGWSQEGLGRASKMSLNAISALERGINAAAKPENATRLAVALKLDAAQKAEFQAAARAATKPQIDTERTGGRHVLKRCLRTAGAPLALTLAAVLVAGMYLANRDEADADRPERDTTPAASTGPSAPGSIAPARLPAVFSAPVNGSGTSSETFSTIGLWTLPSTDTGCSRSPCQAGSTSAGMVRPGQVVQISCMQVGQRIRNGSPEEPGYYEDDRWLQVTPGQDFGEPSGQPLWLSNIFFSRDRLPDDLPLCPD